MKSGNPDFKKGRYLAFLIAVIWITLLTISYLRNASEIESHIFSIALNEARTSFNKDVKYREWAALEGGVYVYPTDYTPPNPYLKIPERDIETKGGKKLTLVNPAYMTRMVHELELNGSGVKGHITSLNPLRPENKADNWESTALKLFEKGNKEHFTLETVDGITALRFMAPLITEEACLKCHSEQGYKVGDIRGGISVSIPYQNYLAISESQKKNDFIFHLGAAIMGLIAIFIKTASSEKHKRKLRAETLKLQQSQERFKFFANIVIEGIIIHLQGNILDLNEAFANIFGYSRDELIGKNFLQLIILPEDIPFTQTQVREGKTTPYEIRAVKKDGTVFPVEIQGHNTQYADKNVRIVSFRDITGQKKAEQALAESEERHRLLADNSTDVIWTINHAGQFTYISPSVTKLRGFSPAEVMAQKPSDFLTPSSLKYYLEGIKSVQQAISKGERFPETKLELEQLCKNGSTVWTESTITGIYKVNGEFVGILGITRDISQRKQLELTLKHSENKFRSLFELSPIGMALVDYETGAFIECNKALLSSIGYTYEELIKTDFWQITPKKYEPQEQQQLLDLKDKGRFGPNEKEYIHKDGHLVPIKIMGFNLTGPNGREVTWGIIEDISQRKKDERALRESKERYDLLAEQSRTINWEVNTEGLYTYVSPVIEQILNYSPDELVGKKYFWEICPPKYRDRVKVAGMATIVNKKTIVNFENPLLAKSGKIIWVLSTGMPILNELGELTGYRGSDTDNTIRKEAEAKLKEYYKELEKINTELSISKQQVEENLSEKNILIKNLESAKLKMEEVNKQKDKYFSIIAHDLKSPFQGLLGLTQIISEDIDKLSFQEVKDYTLLLKDSANNIYKLLENLLEWARLQRDLVVFEPTTVNLNEIVKGIIAIQNTSALHKNIEINNNIPSTITVQADSNMLNTILRNLISNSIKFTPQNGTIELTAVDKREFIEVRIKDTGIGIPKDILPQLFKVGEKTSRLGTEGETSTGLGLVLCKEYIDRHNGKIWAESAVGSGTTFYFTIPTKEKAGYKPDSTK